MAAFGYPEKEPAEVPRKESIKEMIGILTDNIYVLSYLKIN